jgi:hypothetical protein
LETTFPIFHGVGSLHAKVARSIRTRYYHRCPLEGQATFEMGVNAQEPEKKPGSFQDLGADIQSQSDDEPPMGHESLGRQYLQPGVQKVEAITAAWSRKSLILAYSGFVNETHPQIRSMVTANIDRIFLVFYVNSLQQQISGNLTVYVTSAFAEHPLTATTSVMSSIIGAVAKLPTAKIIDIWGRTEGYVLMIIIATLGGPQILL